MSIGAGIFLITVGAILAFAVRDRGGTLDLGAAGVVIMLAGVVGIWLSFHITNRRRRTPGPAVAGPRIVQSNPPVKREVPVSGEPVDGVTERHVELDPAANGLHISVPDRTAPVTSSAGTSSPARDSRQPAESRARRLLRQLRHRH